MAPPAADSTSTTASAASADAPTKSSSSSASRLTGPLTNSGSLDGYKQFDVTSNIGREFPELQLTDILKDDAKLRDLGILVAERGVVFFRNQDIEIDDQKTLAQKLGELTGKPTSSGLHKHALANSKRGMAVNENGRLDDEVSVISSEEMHKYYKNKFKPKKIGSTGWHGDITFERIPADYTILKIVQVPDDVGGDTLWASGYEAYDRLSPEFQRLAERLTAVHYQPAWAELTKTAGVELMDGFRGAPENIDFTFQAEHPVVRTNPVTGWKSLFGAAHQLDAGWYNGVTERESQILKEYFNQLIFENHDLQVRFRWNKNDMAIWDNRSVFHTATSDYWGKRRGNRVVSVGEKPYYDPKSRSRREALNLPDPVVGFP